MPKYGRKRLTRDQIIKAALVLFARDGYEKASVGDIARLAGVSNATVFLHFQAKAGVYAEAMLAAAKRFIETMHEIDGTDSATFAEVAMSWVKLLQSDSQACRLLGSLTADHRDHMVDGAARQVHSMFEDFWQNRLSRLGSEDRRRRDQGARFIVAALAGIVGTRFDDGSATQPESPGNSIRYIEQAVFREP